MRRGEIGSPLPRVLCERDDDAPAGNIFSDVSMEPNRSRIEEWTSKQTSNSCALACSGV